MTNLIKSIVCVLLVATASANAALIQSWDFNGYTGGTSVSAPQGGTLTAGWVNNAGTISSAAGVSDQAIQFSASSPNYDPRIILSFNPAGNIGLVLSYSQKYTGNYVSHQWEWSTDGSNWTPQGSALTSTANWTTHTVDFSGVTALNNTSLTQVWFRDTVTYVPGGSNPNSTVSFDNIQITAVPEPTTVAAGIFGGLFAAGAIGRSLLRRAKQ